ncbi:MAG TPA: hypothetical protein VL261_10290 [Nitrospira sp.]|jgi:hypothetical protein|nr:hypothetical protein [Nitrospira sp.]
MIAAVVVLLVLLTGLPLVGLSLVGAPIGPYLEFPPQTHVVQPAPFSWPVFLVLSLSVVWAVGPVVWRLIASRRSDRTQFRSLRPFPWWGWAGALVTGLSWVVAWNRFPWCSALQPHTFTPLWLGYILIVNGWTLRRTGRCLLLDSPGKFFMLFPLSAAFWWSCEYLNRFVQNWYYVGAEDLTPWQYLVQATIPFSTVLPSVRSTMDLLASFPEVTAGMDRLPPLRCHRQRWAAAALLIAASAGLTGIGIWPASLFPLVWVAPLFLITALQMFMGAETIFSRAEEGDWSEMWLAAVAALICGFCWEMWNSKSLAHWEYAIPAVHRFKLFEMPLLGYAGYLPFGLECLAVTKFIFAHHVGHRLKPR